MPCYGADQAMVTGEATSHPRQGSTLNQLELESSAKNDGPFERQTFTFAKVFKDSRVGDAGVMLDIQQVGVALRVRFEPTTERRHAESGMQAGTRSDGGGSGSSPREECC